MCSMLYVLEFYLIFNMITEEDLIHLVLFQGPIRSAPIDSCICVTDYGIESIKGKVSVLLLLIFN